MGDVLEENLKKRDELLLILEDNLKKLSTERFITVNPYRPKWWEYVGIVFSFIIYVIHFNAVDSLRCKILYSN